ncbi:3D domain-containing protein [Patescibacteria group bacterium]|nr:3D domain-containing protein [Patescibacteria group bacterium]
MTAYTSSVEECDSTPFITADGTHTEWGIVAANFLPFGTKIRIPEYFGDQVFVVHDRMNQRYYYRVDVWMQTKTEAFQFGKRKLKIEVLES